MINIIYIVFVFGVCVLINNNVFLIGVCVLSDKYFVVIILLVVFLL